MLSAMMFCFLGLQCSSGNNAGRSRKRFRDCVLRVALVQVDGRLWVCFLPVGTGLSSFAWE